VFDNANLVAAVRHAADDSRLTLDEAPHALEDNNALPYLRCRVTLTVMVNCANMRKFANLL
jgi:hypothetical protein